MTYQERKYQEINAIPEYKRHLRKIKAVCKKELITKDYQFYNWYKMGGNIQLFYNRRCFYNKH